MLTTILDTPLTTTLNPPPSLAFQMDKETILEMANTALASLGAGDEAVAALRESQLFGIKSVRVDRPSMSQKQQQNIDKQVSRCLFALSPYFMLPPAQKVLEHLIQRFQIHIHNTEDILSAFLPFHETPVFARLLALVRWGKGDGRWQFLSKAQRARAAVSRDTLIGACVKDPSILEFVCRMARRAAREGGARHKAVQSFYCAIVVGCISTLSKTSGDSAQRFCAVLTPYLVEGLGRSAADAPYGVASKMALSHLSARCRLSRDAAGHLLNAAAAGASASARSPLALARALLPVLCVCATQALDALPVRCAQTLRTMPALAPALKRVSAQHDAAPLIQALVSALATPAQGGLASSDNIRTIDAILTARVPLSRRVVETLLAAMSSARGRAQGRRRVVADKAFSRIMKAIDALHPDAMQSALRALVGGGGDAAETLGPLLVGTRHELFTVADGPASGSMANVEGSESAGATLITLSESVHHSSAQVRLRALALIEARAKRKRRRDSGSRGVAAAAAADTGLRALVSRLGDEKTPRVLARVMRVLRALPSRPTGTRAALTALLVRRGDRPWKRWLRAKSRAVELLCQDATDAADPEIEAVAAVVLPRVGLHPLQGKAGLAALEAASRVPHPMLSPLARALPAAREAVASLDSISKRKLQKAALAKTNSALAEAVASAMEDRGSARRCWAAIDLAARDTAPGVRLFAAQVVGAWAKGAAGSEREPNIETLAQALRVLNAVWAGRDTAGEPQVGAPTPFAPVPPAAARRAARPAVASALSSLADCVARVASKEGAGLAREAMWRGQAASAGVVGLVQALFRLASQDVTLMQSAVRGVPPGDLVPMLCGMLPGKPSSGSGGSGGAVVAPTRALYLLAASLHAGQISGTDFATALPCALACLSAPAKAVRRAALVFVSEAGGAGARCGWDKSQGAKPRGGGYAAWGGAETRGVKWAQLATLLSSIETERVGILSDPTHTSRILSKTDAMPAPVRRWLLQSACLMAGKPQMQALLLLGVGDGDVDEPSVRAIRAELERYSQSDGSAADASAREQLVARVAQKDAMRVRGALDTLLVALRSDRTAAAALRRIDRGLFDALPAVGQRKLVSALVELCHDKGSALEDGFAAGGDALYGAVVRLGLRPSYFAKNVDALAKLLKAEAAAAASAPNGTTAMDTDAATLSSDQDEENSSDDEEESEDESAGPMGSNKEEPEATALTRLLSIVDIMTWLSGRAPQDAKASRGAKNAGKSSGVTGSLFRALGALAAAPVGGAGGWAEARQGLLRLLALAFEREGQAAPAPTKPHMASVVRCICGQAKTTQGGSNKGEGRGESVPVYDSTGAAAQTRIEALKLLAALAPAAPTQVAGVVVPVLEFLGSSQALRSKDGFTFSVIQQTIAAILAPVREIPAKGGRKRRQAAHYNVATRVLFIAVRSLPRLPPQRRLPLLSVVVSALPPACLALALAEICAGDAASGVESYTEDAGATGTADDAKDPAESAVDASHDLAHQLALEFPVTQQLEALRALADMVSGEQGLPDGASAARRSDWRAWIAAFMSAHLADADFVAAWLASGETESATATRDALHGLFFSTFRAFSRLREADIAKGDEERDDDRDGQSTAEILSACVDSLRGLLPPASMFEITRQLLSAKTPESVRLRALEMLADALQDDEEALDDASAQPRRALEPAELEQYVPALEGVVIGDTKATERSRQSALLSLDAIARRCTAGNPGLFVSLGSRILAAVGKNATTGKDAAKRTTSKRASRSHGRRRAAAGGEADPEMDRAVAQNTMLCASTIVAEAGVRALPLLPALVPPLLRHFEGSLARYEAAGGGTAVGDEAVEAEVLFLLTALAGVEAVVKALPKFVVPYVGRIVSLLLAPAVSQAAQQQADVRAGVGSVLSLIGACVPPRVLLPHALGWYQAAARSGPEAVTRLFRTLTGTAGQLTPTTVADQYKRFFKLYLIALDTRKQHGPRIRAKEGEHQGPANAVDAVEDEIISGFLALVMKLNESQLKSIFLALVQWASLAPAADAQPGPASKRSRKGDAGAEQGASQTDIKAEAGADEILRADSSRVVTLLRTARRLEATLGAIFTPYLSHVTDHTALALRQAARARARTEPTDEKSQKKKRRKRKSAEGSGAAAGEPAECRSMARAAVGLVDEWVTNDPDKTFDKTKLERLCTPLVDLLESGTRWSEDVDAYAAFVRDEFVPCTVHLVKQLQDVRLWKMVNHALIGKGESAKPEVRKAAVDTIKALFKKVSHARSAPLLRGTGGRMMRFNHKPRSVLILASQPKSDAHMNYSDSPCPGRAHLARLTVPVPLAHSLTPLRFAPYRSGPNTSTCCQRRFHSLRIAWRTRTTMLQRLCKALLPRLRTSRGKIWSRICADLGASLRFKSMLTIMFVMKIVLERGGRLGQD